jgi:hypothetical protein
VDRSQRSARPGRHRQKRGSEAGGYDALLPQPDLDDLVSQFWSRYHLRYAPAVEPSDSPIPPQQGDGQAPAHHQEHLANLHDESPAPQGPQEADHRDDRPGGERERSQRPHQQMLSTCLDMLFTLCIAYARAGITALRNEVPETWHGADDYIIAPLNLMRHYHHRAQVKVQAMPTDQALPGSSTRDSARSPAWPTGSTAATAHPRAAPCAAWETPQRQQLPNPNKAPDRLSPSTSSTASRATNRRRKSAPPRSCRKAYRKSLASELLPKQHFDKVYGRGSWSPIPAFCTTWSYCQMCRIGSSKRGVGGAADLAYMGIDKAEAEAHSMLRMWQADSASALAHVIATAAPRVARRKVASAAIIAAGKRTLKLHEQCRSGQSAWLQVHTARCAHGGPPVKMLLDARTKLSGSFGLRQSHPQSAGQPDHDLQSGHHRS